MKTIISLIAGLCLASFAAAQCSIANANFTHGNLFADPLNQWEYVDLYGNQGHDGFWFTGVEDKIYIFTTLDEFGGSGPGAGNDDYQITILDANGNPAPGAYGNAFHDDLNYSAGETDPLLIWSPLSSGSYKVLITRWHLGGCNRINITDQVRVAYRGTLTASSHVAVWTGAEDNDADNHNNWLHFISGVGQSLGYPPAGNSWQYIMASNVSAQVQGNYLVCDELFLGASQRIELGDNKMIEVNSRLFNPLVSNGFWGGNTAGVIKSMNPQKQGRLVLKGFTDTINLVGQFQNIDLNLHCNITFRDGGSNIFNPNRFRNIKVYAANMKLDHHVRMEMDGYFWFIHANAKVDLGPHARLVMEDGARMVHSNNAQGGGISFNGGMVEWNCQNRAVRFTPVWAGNNQLASIGFEFNGSTNTKTLVNYYTSQLPTTLPINSPLVKVSSREYFTVEPDQNGLIGRVIFKYHSGSGIGNTALNEITMAGLTHAQSWSAIASTVSNGYIHAFPLAFDHYQQYAPASTGNSHVLREDGAAEETIIEVFPNPATDFVNITTSEEGRISIFSIDGKEVIKQHLLSGQSRIQLAGLKSGQYMVRFLGSSSQKTERLILK